MARFVWYHRKIYSRILDNRIRLHIEDQLEETNVDLGRWEVPKNLHSKTNCRRVLEIGRDVHLAFIDLEKTFDRVPWNELWKILLDRNSDLGLLKGIQSFYNRCRNYVRTANSISNEFLTTSGVRQGEILSPYLFVILMDEIVTNDHHQINANIVWPPNQCMFSLTFLWLYYNRLNIKLIYLHFDLFLNEW